MSWELVVLLCVFGFPIAVAIAIIILLIALKFLVNP